MFSLIYTYFSIINHVKRGACVILGDLSVNSEPILMKFYYRYLAVVQSTRSIILMWYAGKSVSFTYQILISSDK